LFREQGAIGLCGGGVCFCVLFFCSSGVFFFFFFLNQSFPLSFFLVFLFFDSQFFLSCGKLRREPATRWFHWSFAPIQTFNKRFTSQYHYKNTTKFTLASPYAGIVHHLSGPNRCALTQIFHQLMVFFSPFNSPCFKAKKIKRKKDMTSRIMIGRWCISSHWKKKTISHLFKRKKEPQKRDPLFSSKVYFHWCVMIFLIITLAHMLDSLVRVTRRVSWDSKMSNHWKEKCVFLVSHA